MKQYDFVSRFLFFPILILITGLFIAPLAVAGDLIISRGMFEDSAGTLIIADVVGREFKPIGPTLSKGITKSVHWLRLHVQAPATGSKAVLLSSATFLNEIRLYAADTADPQGWKTRVTGNYDPCSDRDRATCSLSFVVNAVAPVTTYYLRLKTSTPSKQGGAQHVSRRII